MAYTMIEPIKQTLFEVDNLMKYRNYQPVVDKITEIIEQVSAFLFLYAPREKSRCSDHRVRSMHAVIIKLLSSYYCLLAFLIFLPPKPFMMLLISKQVPWDPFLREMRADAYLGLGNVIHAISDIKAMTKLTNDNTEGYYKLASLHYQLGEAEEALMEIRECLKLDPDHKDCHPLYKSLKKVAKHVGKAQEALNNQVRLDFLPFKFTSLLGLFDTFLDWIFAVFEVFCKFALSFSR